MPDRRGSGTSLSDVYCHKVMELERIVGYFAYIASPEPTYAKIYDGAWPIRPSCKSYFSLRASMLFTASSPMLRLRSSMISG